MHRKTLTILAAFLMVGAWIFAGVRIANAQEVQEGVVGTFTVAPGAVVVTPNPTVHPFRPNTVVGPVVTFGTPDGYPVDWAALRAARLAELAEAAGHKILFAFDSVEFEEDAGLSDLATLLSENPDVGLAVAGHTDRTGSDEYNIGLGVRRAEAVRSALLDHGVDSARVRVQSFGERAPVSEFAPPSMNRRVEITLIDLFSE